MQISNKIRLALIALVILMAGAVDNVAFGQTRSITYDPTTGKSGSVTAAGVSGTNAPAIQGVTNGVPVPADLTQALTDILTAIRDAAQDTTPIPVLPEATVTGGTTGCYKAPTTASTNATLCKNGATAVYSFDVRNPTTTPACLRMYNLGTTPDPTSATGYITSYTIPASSSASTADGGFIRTLTIPITGDYPTGMGFAVTGGGGTSPIVCTPTDNSNAPAGIFVDLQIK